MNNGSKYNNTSQVKNSNIFMYIAIALFAIGILGYMLKSMFFAQAKKSPFYKTHVNKDISPTELCSQIQTIVIDPGHGGKDSGTKGQYSLEKENTLAIGLRLGKIIKKHHPYIRVIYTRTKDVFVSLQDRVDIANTNNADLFISIHCNSDGIHTIKHTRRARRKAYSNKYISYSTKTNGTETYILNSDYLLEENLLYTGPKYNLALQVNSHLANFQDGLLMLNYNPDEDYMDQSDMFRMFTCFGCNYNDIPQETEFDRLKKSYQVARLIEAEFAKIGRKSRGVHESHFVVLKETIMPAVLVETGFMTNLQEEAYLHSELGRMETATGIYNAISKYIEFVKSSI